LLDQPDIQSPNFDMNAMPPPNGDIAKRFTNHSGMKPLQKMSFLLYLYYCASLQRL
jgi:hypothetical protein